MEQRKRKKVPKRTPEELRRSEELREEIQARVKEGEAKMIAKYGSEWRVPDTYEELMEFRERLRRIDHERELEARPLRRLGRWLRSKAA